MKRLKKVPSPGTVIAVIALAVALGGTAYAAKKIGAKQLKANAVTEKKIAPGAVSKAKLAADQQTAWALVNGSGSGSIVAQSGGVTTVAGGGGGAYFVKFPFDLVGHAVVGNVHSAQGGGEMATGICGSPSPVAGVERLFCTPTNPAENTSSVARVEVQNSAGGPTAKNFYIAVLPK